tara:strand:+ start:3898 stop:5187 length:1290 start_codon:yes stop_codon:yes gene_type:complete
MKFTEQLKQQSRLSLGGQYLAVILFALLIAGMLVAKTDPAWLSWLIASFAAAGFAVTLSWNKKEGPKESEEEELAEIARQAIRNEATRLEKKRHELEKVLIAYGEWMELPDYKMLQTINWQNEAHQQMDHRVAKLIDDEADRMLQVYSSGEYWKDGKFEGRKALLDLIEFTESIARLYQPESERPLLELNMESLLRSINRASLQIILLLEELPIVEVKEMNLRKVTDSVRKASKVYKKYEELQPILKPVRYLWQGSKLFLASNPLLAAGWIAGSEVLWKGGKAIGKKAMDAYLLSFVRQTLGIIAWETASLYDSTHRYRNPDWLYGVEIAHLLSRFDATQDALREAFQEIERLPLQSSYDRLFLYRCIAQNVSPKPKYFAQPGLLTNELKQQLYDQLDTFYEKIISANVAVDNEETRKWREGLEDRLGI